MSPLIGCAALAVLELDAAMVAQTLASRPLIIGIVFGALGGAPLAGAIFGGTFELMSLVNLPVGGSLTWSGPVAAGTAALLSGADCSPAAVLAGGLAAGIVHSRLEGFERARRAATCDRLVGLAERGAGALGLSIASSLACHAAMTFAVSFAAVVLFSAFDRQWWPRAPEFVRAGAELGVSVSPWIGLSSVAAWGLRRA